MITEGKLYRGSAPKRAQGRGRSGPVRMRRLTLWVTMSLLLVMLGIPSNAVQPVRAADEFDPVLDRLNTYRSWAGLPPMTRNEALDSAAAAHAEYYRQNHEAETNPHHETPGNPGFTGEWPSDRAQAQGYPTSMVGENMAFSGSMATAMQMFVDSVYHRLLLMDPRFTEIGFGAVSDSEVAAEVIDMGAPEWTPTGTPEWVAWPPDLTTGVPVSFCPWGNVCEQPDPFPQANYPIGYPITLTYNRTAQMTVESATLETGGQPVPVLIGSESDRAGQRTFFMAAEEPLAPGTTYAVNVSGNVDGMAFNHDWTFRTAATADEQMGQGGANVEGLHFGLLAPAPFATVAPGTVHVTASAESDSPIVAMELTINGQTFGTTDSATVGGDVDLTAGIYTALARAKDADGETLVAEWDIVVAPDSSETEWFTSAGEPKADQINATMRSLVEAFRWHLYGQSWDGQDHPDLPSHVEFAGQGEPLETWVTGTTFDQAATEATLKSLVEVFRWHFWGISWDGAAHCDVPTHIADCTVPQSPQGLDPWFTEAGEPIPQNIEATLRSLVEAFRWHFWAHTWDGAPHPDLPTHIQ